MTTTTTPTRERFSTREAERAIAHGRLMAAIAVQLEAGCRVPCVGRPELWTSDDAADLGAAAHQCRACPALTACKTYIENNSEVAGVWAGILPSERTNK